MGIVKSKLLRRGAWRTLESGWNAQFWVSFFAPKNAKIKIRYGAGWPLGWDSQNQTLDDNVIKWLKVTNSSLAYARIQVYVPVDMSITYTYFSAPFDGILFNSI
ncbi:hypothetical protein L0663_18105 [Dyadobacter sp. CY107]|uniref:hypothetical protein n=1 Tax=Dyadobacter fanqingshengii TaxID=2906443 RepID=UPI001F27E9CE|nr:hypothetical protein [Dyadobacter fanqingshengii]MCF2505311.1 hypothetical protein [Dyadobacter fanqingshengii]